MPNDPLISGNPRFITEAEVEGQILPDGGTTDQVLAKKTEADYDLKWANVVGAGGVLGPGSSTDGNLAVFDGTDGGTIKDGGLPGIGGSIADKQIAFGNGTDITGNNYLKFDVGNARLVFASNFGDPPAQTGDLAVSDSFTVFGRNANDDADIPILEFSDAHRLALGDYSGGATPFLLLQLIDGTDSTFSAGDTGNAQILAIGGQATLQGGLAYLNLAGTDEGEFYFSCDGDQTHAVEIDTDATTIQNILTLTPRTDAPGTPVEGMIYADTDHHLYYYNGTTWKQLDNTL